MARPTRWETDTAEGHSEWYIKRFRNMTAQGDDLFGEARLIDAMVGRRSRILDAGCGPGRLGGYLHGQGHTVVGVDADPKLIEAAEHDYPGPRWLVGDLSELDLPARGETEPFDAAILAGNVLAFVAPDTEADVLTRVGSHLRPDGFLAVGFHTNRIPMVAYEAAVAASGLTEEHRFATWDLRPWRDDADFIVDILRRPTT